MENFQALKSASVKKGQISGMDDDNEVDDVGGADDDDGVGDDYDGDGGGGDDVDYDYDLPCKLSGFPLSCHSFSATASNNQIAIPSYNSKATDIKKTISSSRTQLHH